LGFMFRLREHMSLLLAYEQARPNTRESLWRPVELAQELESRDESRSPPISQSGGQNEEDERHARARGLPMVTKIAAVASRHVRIATATAELEGLSSAQHDDDRGTRRPAWQLAEPAPFRLPIDSDPAGAGRTKPRARGACRSAAAVAAGRALRRRHRRLEARTRLGWRAI